MMKTPHSSQQALLGRVRTAFSATLILFLCLTSAPLSAVAQPESSSEISILHPAQSPAQTYRFHIDAIDPSSASNPKGSEFPGYRGENQLILYTPAFSPSTRTNDAGLEAVVVGGVIQNLGRGDSSIPVNGFVLSGHGAASQWLSRFAKPGASVSIDQSAAQVVIRMTPAVYAYEVDAAIQRAESRVPVDGERYHKHRESAKRCQRQLNALADQPVNPEMVALAERCKQDANRAFYNTIESKPAEFRGAWIRPAGNNPEQIARVIQQLKGLHVQHIFLETYYQGKTVYPSPVMASYGLTEQHPMFKGGDPVRLWIEAAHREGLKVHLWAQVFFAGNSRENAELYGPILQKYPQWRNVQQRHWNNPNPVISDVEPGHYFLDPANPEVRQFLEKLLLEMVSQYEADGLNLDYIRYPASAAVSKANYLNSTWGYTDAGRQQFQAMIEKERNEAEAKRVDALRKAGKKVTVQTAKQPSADPKDFTPTHPLWGQWVAWRKEQVTSFVKTISEKTHALKPNMLLSAVIFPSSDSTYAQKLQDYPRWVQEGAIQALTPIGLSPTPERMAQQARQLKQQIQDKVPVYVGIFGMYNREDPIQMVQQIDAVHQAEMAGVVLFDWSRLTPAYDEALREGPFRE